MLQSSKMIKEKVVQKYLTFFEGKNLTSLIQTPLAHCFINICNNDNIN